MISLYYITARPLADCLCPIITFCIFKTKQINANFKKWKQWLNDAVNYCFLIFFSCFDTSPKHPRNKLGLWVIFRWLFTFCDFWNRGITVLDDTSLWWWWWCWFVLRLCVTSSVVTDEDIDEAADISVSKMFILLILKKNSSGGR